MTLLGLLVVRQAPVRSFGKLDTGYSPRFSAEEFGLVGALPRSATSPRSTRLLRAHHATEVSLVEA